MPRSKSSHDRSNHLLLSYQAGDTDSLDTLYRLWHPYIKKRVRLSNAFPIAEIDDVSSETWVFIQQDACKWDVNRSGWFRFLDFKIKQTIDVSLRKRHAFKRLAQTHAFSLDEKLDDPDSPHVPLASNEPPAIDFLIFQDRLAAAQDAILKCEFTENVRTILEMRFADQNYAVISERIGIERARVKKLLYAAIRQIRTHLVTD